MNDLVCDDIAWPPIPTKLPSNVMKFEDKNGNDSSDQFTNCYATKFEK